MVEPAQSNIRQLRRVDLRVGETGFGDPDERDAVNSQYAATFVLKRIERPVHRVLLEMRVEVVIRGIAHGTAPHVPRRTYRRLARAT